MSGRRCFFALLLALAGCDKVTYAPPPFIEPRWSPPPSVTVAASPTAKPTADLTGSLVVPSGLSAVPRSTLVSDQTGSLVSDQTGSLVSDQTGSLVSDQTGSLVSDQTGSYVVLAVAERALGKTAVYLADTSLRPIRGLRPVETDASGNFVFKGVPAGFTYQVVAVVRTASGKLGRLSTLARPGQGAAISSASTIVAASVLPRDGGLPGAIDTEKFAQAVKNVGTDLTPRDLPDFADPAAVAARGQALSSASPVLGALLGAIRTRAAESRPNLGDLQAALPSPAPSATATPGPVPSSSFSPGATNVTNMDQDIIYGTSLVDCTTSSVEHEFLLSGTYANFPLTLIVKSPQFQEVARATIAQPTSNTVISIPEGCPHYWELRDASDNVVATPPAFAVRAGAPRKINPPL